MKTTAKRMVACVACGRVIVASKNGHPRRHSPSNEMNRKLRSRGNNGGTCDGTFIAGEKP